MAERGEGQGQGKQPINDGGVDFCYCHECGIKVKHDRGKPCNEIKCSKCGKPMTGQVKANEWIEGLQLAEGAEPRKEIMLFPYGQFNHPSYGKLNFDHKFFMNIIENYESNILGTKPFMDKEHKMGEALAWFNSVPYIRQNIGLYAKPDWTDEGKKLTSEKVYMYFSPWYEDYLDPQTKKVHKDCFRGGAATNIPFLKTMPPISDDVKMSDKSIIMIKLNEINIETQSDTGGNADEGKSGMSGNDKINTKDKNMNEKLIALFKKIFSVEEIKDDEIAEKLKKYFEDSANLKKEFEELKTKKELEELKTKKEDKKDVDVKQMSIKLDDTEKRLVNVTKELTEQKKNIVVGKALSEGKIIPKDKEYWEKKFMENPNNTSDIIEHLNVSVQLGEAGVDGKGVEITSNDPGAQLVEKANVIKLEKKITLAEAMEKARDENPKLSKKYDEKYS